MNTPNTLYPTAPTISGGNSNSLLHTNGVTESSIAQGTLGVHGAVANFVGDLESRQRGLISRLFTERGLTKVLQEAKEQSVKQFTDYQRHLFCLASDTKLDMAHSACLAMTRELKVGNQEKFTSLVLDKHESLRRAVQEKRDSFLVELDQAYTNAERFQHRPTLYNLATASLEKETVQFFEWLDRLLDDFIKLTQERLAEYRKAEEEQSRRPARASSNWGSF